MPQLTHSSGSTCAISADRPPPGRGIIVIASYGQSRLHCRQPVQMSSFTTDGGGALARRFVIRGSASSNSVASARTANAIAGGTARTSGTQNAYRQSRCTVSGM